VKDRRKRKKAFKSFYRLVSFDSRSLSFQGSLAKNEGIEGNKEIWSGAGHPLKDNDPLVRFKKAPKVARQIATD